MKILNISLYALIVGIFTLTTAFVTVDGSDESYTKKISVETFTVRGVCGMCEERIEETVMFLKGVKQAEWDIEKQTLTVVFSSKKISVDAIQKALVEAGHDAGDLKASQDAYDKLPGCCRYRELEIH
ncbi:MAG: cation transporter [Flavobacteriales bacterium]|nr:cation transporter [Flavobacteriales bacterium]